MLCLRVTSYHCAITPKLFFTPSFQISIAACHMKPDMIYIHWFLVMRTVHNLEDIGLATDQLKNSFKIDKHSSVTAEG